MPADGAEHARELREQRRRERAERPVTPEEVLRRNYVERIKHERAPYDLIVDLPKLAQTPYEAIPEEDILRLQWWGLYHDKPKVGYFMMRIKIPNGVLSPAKLRAIGELAVQYGRNQGEITTRQDVQLHWIQLEALPEIFRALEQAGLSTKGGCGDVLRNITGCPVAGVDREELFDTWPLVQEIHRRYSGNPAHQDLPRKHKWTVSACPYHCNAPEIHDVALVGTWQDGQPGFSVRVGGGLSTVPRIAQSLGVFVRPEEALDVLGAILDIWRRDLRYRVSRARARFKFMVEDEGPARIRELVQEHLGRKLTDLKEEPRPKGRTDHMGVHPQKQEGRYYVGFPVFPGLLQGDQMIRVAAIVEEFGSDIRLTREQNLIVTGIPADRLDDFLGRMESEAGLSLRVNPIRGRSIGCTGEPYCNFSVGETKQKLVEIVEHLEQVFGDAVSELHIHLDGCPHACGQHWVGDVGIQGTTLTTGDGKIQAYDVLLRGGLGPAAGIAKALVRRVPSAELKFCIERLVRAYLEGRQDGETIQSFFRRLPDEQLVAIARGSSEVAVGNAPD
jgi:sulfite reductase (ferredoxin)